MYPHDPPKLAKLSSFIGTIDVLISFAVAVMGLLSVFKVLHWSQEGIAKIFFPLFGLFFGAYSLSVAKAFNKNQMRWFAYGALMLNVLFLILNLTLRK